VRHPSEKDVRHAVEPIELATPRPVRTPIMTQGWHNLTYVHWRYEPRRVQSLLPQGFTVDTFDGDAWVGLIPFEMHDIAFSIGRFGNIPTGPFGTFPETNVRTYIVDSQGRRGVWFFSLDINRIAPTLIARVGYGLPYCFADMTVEVSPGLQGTEVHYASTRRWPARDVRKPFSSVNVVIGQKEAVDADSLDAFTSARWALGSRFLGKNLWAEVDHPSWELHQATLTRCDENVLAAAGLPNPTGDPVVRWSPGVQVRIARPHIQHRP
jgi:uncharacterized protein